MTEPIPFPKESALPGAPRVMDYYLQIDIPEQRAR